MIRSIISQNRIMLTILLNGGNLMFYVKYKSDTGANPIKVYHIRDDKTGYPNFLILENGSWKYRSAKFFEVVEEDC